jgi:hypothetical protein
MTNQNICVFLNLNVEETSYCCLPTEATTTLQSFDFVADAQLHFQIIVLTISISFFI